MNSFRTFNNNYNMNGTENESLSQQIPSFYKQQEQNNINTDDIGLTYLSEYIPVQPALATQPAVATQPSVEVQPAVVAQPAVAIRPFGFTFGNNKHPETGRPVPLIFPTNVNEIGPRPGTIPGTIPEQVPGPVPGPIQHACKGITMHPSNNEFKQAMENLQQSRKEKQVQEDRNKLIDTLYTELATIRSQIEKLTKSTDTIYEILRKI